MKKIIVICCFTSLCLTVFLESLITGGVSYGEVYNPSPVFRVTIENNVSKVTTFMYVLAPTAEIAKENVYLNGWSVKDVTKLSEKERSEINLSSIGLPNEGTGRITVNSLKDKPNALGDNASIPLSNGVPYGYPEGLSLPQKSSPTQGFEGNVIAEQNQRNRVFDNGAELKPADNLSASPMNSLYIENAGASKGGVIVEDNLKILPDSPALEYLMTVNFDFANVDAKMNPQLDYRLGAMPKNGKYIVFGHADGVSVGENAEYKDNYALSYMRAEAVKKMMTDKGMSPDNIRAVGLGIKYPLEDSKGSSLANRRAEIYGFRTQK